ncbi:hypothetical protein BJ875DRAFT_484127 [Amylocarpus encephaloides]|uniref:Rhodopsin domain-containing protein n=1 Tax=Amylocarpus encephaloides TaxID=45428 RepID=A0A9P7YJ20_9HELO|nr:hypothetical protein BJ875DRAFT_484127 [Amylocarpus encephaloides]
MYLPRLPSSAYSSNGTLGPIDGADNGQRILGITGFFASFACTAVILRMYVRTAILNTVGMDDYAMLFAMICSATAFVFFVLEVNAGVGEHYGNPHLMSNLPTILHYSYHHGWLIVTGISSVKISIGFFLLRLVQGKWFKRCIILWIVFIVVFTLACVGTIIFQCLPIDAAWDFTLRLNPATRCYQLQVFRGIGLFNGAINIFTDFLFATLPIPIVIPLDLNIRAKISLISILSLGYFACAASIVKEYLLSTFFDNTDSFFNNAFNIWNFIELNVGILAASLPALRPLFANLLETATSLKSRTSVHRKRRPSKSEIQVVGQRQLQLHRNYRFCQPHIEDASHDPRISLPLTLGHEKETRFPAPSAVMTPTDVSPTSTMHSKHNIQISKPYHTFTGTSTTTRISTGGHHHHNYSRSRLTKEEESGLWRQDSATSLGSSNMSRLEKLEEGLEEEGIRYVRRERERRERGRAVSRGREERRKGILKTTEVSVTR